MNQTTKNNLKILGCGTMMVDIFLRDLEKIAEPETVVYPEKPIEIFLGGHAIDFGIDLARLGMDPSEIGVIGVKGEGIVGEYLAREVAKYGLQTFFQEIKGIDNGKNVVINVKGEGRRLHMHPGANWFLDPEWVKQVVRESSFKIFSIRPGYSGVDLHLREIFEEVKKKNAFLLLDIMKPHPERPPLFLLPDLELVDAIHCNEKEAMVNTDKEDPEEALKELLVRGGKVIFLTKGEKGAEIITENFRISQPSFQKIEAVDATGCGDAFCAGVYYKMVEYNHFGDLRRLPVDKLKELLVFAQAVGASAATAPGCVEGVSKETVDKILNESKEIFKKTKVRKK